MLKLYCYADETGQDTMGRLFLVSVVLTEKDNFAELREKIRIIEKETKGKTKWTRTSNAKKILFMEAILRLKNLRGKIFYSIHKSQTAYISLVGLAVGKAVIQRIKDCGGEYKVQVIIDDLNEVDKEIVRRELKSLNIKYDKIKMNLRDEQELFLRFADAIAGFLRDYFESKKYAKKLIINEEKFKKFFTEL